jgi:hypothetical protein
MAKLEQSCGIFVRSEIFETYSSQIKHSVAHCRLKQLIDANGCGFDTKCGAEHVQTFYKHIESIDDERIANPPIEPFYQTLQRLSGT